MTKKVLVVDNNKVILRILTYMLEKMGHTVKTAENGLSALEIIDEYQPEVMFIDLIMPKISGDRLCRIIRKKAEFDSVFLVILSAIAAEEKIDFLRFGANACIAKGPGKEMEKHILKVLEHAEKGNHSLLTKEILGSQNIYEREITKELLATRKHFEITLENMGDGFLELTRDAKIIYTNAAATSFFDTPEEKLLSTNILDQFTGKQRDYIEKRLYTLKEDPVEIGEEISLKLYNRYILLKLLPVNDGQQQSIIVLIRDISRRKHAEQELKKITASEREHLISQLQEALEKVKLLSGIIPICSSCKQIRDDKGYWHQVEAYIKNHSEAEFSHSICPDCAERLYPEFYKKDDD
jgi:PAS domain S-box-containing protein